MPLPAWIALAALFVTVMLQGLTFAFWAGRLSQRVTNLEKGAEGDAGLGEKVIRLTVEMEHANAALLKLGTQMEGVNRQLGNIAMGRVGQAAELGGMT
jgi:hypothetical protein